MDGRSQNSKALARDPAWGRAELLIAGANVVAADIHDVVPVSETPWLAERYATDRRLT